MRLLAKTIIMDPEHSDAFWSTGFAIFWIVLFLMVFIPAFFALLSIQNAFQSVSAENRKISPNETWLVLIPVFGLFWQFIMVSRMADSLQAEFKARNIKIEKENRPAFNIGIANCILLCIPGYCFLTIVTMPIFLVQVNKY